MKHTINFNSVPTKNPMNEPRAARMATLESALPINSPNKAPKKGPIIIPTGPNQNPTTRPIVQPHTPYWLPPYNLVPYNGITYSNITVRMVTPAHVHKNFDVNGGSACNCCINKAAKQSGGPGRNGKIHPANPTSINITPNPIQRKSILSISELNIELH
jgi:hypothetical protein